MKEVASAEHSARLIMTGTTSFIPLLQGLTLRMASARSSHPNFFYAGAVVNLCLAGFVAAIRMTSLLGMGMIRDTYVTSLSRFTMLHSPAVMTLKHAKAFRALLVITDENGNHLHVILATPPPPNKTCSVPFANRLPKLTTYSFSQGPQVG